MVYFPSNKVLKPSLFGNGNYTPIIEYEQYPTPLEWYSITCEAKKQASTKAYNGKTVEEESKVHKRDGAF